jgi:diguanylate cyclase (GGDEF)-like protein
MDDRIRVLLIEDVAADVELEMHELRRFGLRCEGRCVETEQDFRRELEDFRPHVILSDFSMPHFDGMTALAIARELHAEIPFIFVSGTIGEEHAIRALKNGATDYVLKTNLVRLPPAVERALQDTRDRAARRQAEAELQATRERLQGIVSSLRDVVWSVAVPARDVLYISPSSTVVYRRAPEEFYDKRVVWSELIHPDDRIRAAAAWEQAVRGATFDCEYRVFTPDRAVRWIHSRGTPVKGRDGSVVRIDGIARDITERHEQAQKIAHLSRIHAVLSGINAAMLRTRERDSLFKEACRVAVQAGDFKMAWIGVVDAATSEGRVAAWAGVDDAYIGAVRFTGREDRPGSALPASRAVRGGKPVICDDLESEPSLGDRRGEMLARGYRSLAALPMVVEGRPLAVLVLCAGEPGFFDDEEVGLLNELTADISFALENIGKEEKLSYLAYYDPLTGLANRDLYRERLEQNLRAARSERRALAVVMFDVERFRHINDTLGRKNADGVLRQLAARLAETVPDRNDLARINADSFAASFRDMREAELGRFLRDRVFPVLFRPFAVDGEPLRISIRAGISLYPNDGADPEVLMRNAEAALQDAKARNEHYSFYAPDMNSRVAVNLVLENKLRSALEKRQFVLHYQPKVELDSGRVVGLEALIRWNDHDRGLVHPLTFIPLLEETGLILEVGAWVLEQAASDYRALSAAVADCPRIAVNVSPLQLRQGDFAATVAAAVRADGRALGLDIEITESVVMDHIESNIAKLQAIRDMGVGIAIDDFGTGYSSLAYISKLPVNALKIDRSFVHTMAHNAEDRSIVSSIISLAHALRLKVVAEGVETQEQRALLHSLGCDEMQGFLLAPPVPIARIRDLLRGVGSEPSGSARGDHGNHRPAPAPERRDRREPDPRREDVHAAGPSARPQHVPGEEHGEVQDHADHRSRDPGERCGEAQVAVRRLHERASQQDEQERRQEGEERRDHRAQAARERDRFRPERRPAPGADEPDEGDDHDQRARCGLAEGKAVDHLRGRKPVVMLDGALVDVGQHRVSAAEREQRRLGEEPRHLREDVVPAGERGDDRQRAHP